MVEPYPNASIPKGFRFLDDEWYRLLDVIKAWAKLELREELLLDYLQNTPFTNPDNKRVAEALLATFEGNK